MTKAERLARGFAIGQQIEPFSTQEPEFDLPAGYAVQRDLTALRMAAGAIPIGVKVGFTNTQIWDQYGIHAPIHAPVFDTTVALGAVPIRQLMEPLIEPEVIFRLRATPTAGMDDAALLACVEAAAPGFEIVQSIFAGWRCKVPDSVAAGGMHAALVVGEWVDVDQSWLARLRDFTVTLSRDDVVQDEGTAGNLLGEGPLAVLRHLVGLDTADPLPAGALISTGTVTRALPVNSGEHWQARFDGLPFAPISVQLV